MNKKMYSTGEAAKILRTSRITVFNKIKNGQIQAEKIGRNYVIAQEDLLEALGKVVGKNKKEKIETAIKKAIKEYGPTFKKLAEE
jgi:excisionase family DNA binding protein